MRIAEIHAYHVPISLRRPIRHALAERTRSQNLIIRCQLEDGTVGWGEGVPRQYVTGESIEEAFDLFNQSQLKEQLGDRFPDFPAVIDCVDRLTLARKPDDLRCIHGNAARCAVELSILDAFGHYFNCPLSRLTQTIPSMKSLHHLQASVQYSGAITAESGIHEFISSLKMKIYGFAQCKVKVGILGQNDPSRIKRIRSILGNRVDLRIDANASWALDRATEQLAILSPFKITSVEQPLPHEQAKLLPSLRSRTDIPIMLDESLCSERDAHEAIENGLCDLFNIRISKCGGFVRSVRLACLAHRFDLGYQLGCQVGETGILSAAGRHFACSVSGISYLEGSYDRHLVREQLTHEDLTFGYGGRAPILNGPGLGITVDQEKVKGLCTKQQRWTFH